MGGGSEDSGLGSGLVGGLLPRGAGVREEARIGGRGSVEGGSEGAGAGLVEVGVPAEWSGARVGGEARSGGEGGGGGLEEVNGVGLAEVGESTGWSRAGVGEEARRGELDDGGVGAPRGADCSGVAWESEFKSSESRPGGPRSGGEEMSGGGEGAPCELHSFWSLLRPMLMKNWETSTGPRRLSLRGQ